MMGANVGRTGDKLRQWHMAMDLCVYDPGSDRIGSDRKKVCYIVDGISSCVEDIEVWPTTSSRMF